MIVAELRDKNCCFIRQIHPTAGRENVKKEPIESNELISNEFHARFHPQDMLPRETSQQAPLGINLEIM